jgi:hypothetical protein
MGMPFWTQHHDLDQGPHRWLAPGAKTWFPTPIPAMARALKAVVSVAIGVAGLSALLPSAGLAGSSRYTSGVSEVDACNQAQYLMPAGAVLQGFQLDTSTRQGITSFSCQVRWSDRPGAQPTQRPILFPNRVAVPLFSL